MEDRTKLHREKMKVSVEVLMALLAVITALPVITPPAVHASDPCATTYRGYYYCRTDTASGLTYYQKYPGTTMSVVRTGASASAPSPNTLATQACIYRNYDMFPECPGAVSTYCNG